MHYSVAIAKDYKMIYIVQIDAQVGIPGGGLGNGRVIYLQWRQFKFN